MENPATFRAWRLVPISEYGEERACHTLAESKELHELRVQTPDTADSTGAPFVLVGPPMRVIVAEAVGDCNEAADGDEGPQEDDDVAD